MSENNMQPQQDINEMMQIRRDKLKTYEDMGVQPFGHRYEWL